MKHKFKSIDGAVRRIRELEKIVASYGAIVSRLNNERQLLAKLAARGPCFYNPLEAMVAEKLRDDILRRVQLNPDGTSIEKTTAPGLNNGKEQR